MRYLYSVVRFVPDPARGEYVNVAAILGSEETGEWDVRQVENLRRAGYNAGFTPLATAVRRYVAEFLDRADRYR